MTREQLEHVLRAAAAIASENSLVVVGSQAVLLPFPNAPAALLVSREFGYHADGVGPETAVMPADWMQRASLHYIGDVTAICPEIHDLAVSKAVAGRDKDAEFVRVLLKERMIDIETLRERINCLDPALHSVASVLAWAQRRAQEASA